MNIETIPQIPDFETQVKEFLKFREMNASKINTEVCEAFAIDGITNEQIENYFHTDPETTKIIRFVLESFAKPNDPTKARRKDGSHISVHSLQLFQSAKDYFKIENPNVGRAVLVHDILEDTQVSEEEIKVSLGEREAQLAFQMTDEYVPEELTRGLDKVDIDRLGIVKFCEKLKLGGDTIAMAEIMDRIDDLSDLAYLTKKLESKPEESEKVKQALISKFGKCVYTIDEITKGVETQKVVELKTFFHALVNQRILEMKEKFNLEITQSEVDGEVENYKKRQYKSPTN